MRNSLPSDRAAAPIHAVEVLSEMLGHSIGADAAAEAVEEAVQALGFGRELDREQALSVLERISTREGVVGIAARFAKSRVHLHWSAVDE